MQISKIIVKNFRLLKNFSIDLERDLSLIVGKNNCGKTSLLKVLNKFLGSGESARFQFNDFSISFREHLISQLFDPEFSENDYVTDGISLRILIKYDDGDDLEFISPILQNLDTDNCYAVLGFDYRLGYMEYKSMREDYDGFKLKEEEKKNANPNYKEKDAISFIESVYSRYIKIQKKTIAVDKDGNIDEDNYIDLKDIPTFKLDNLISFKYIDARRAVDNAESDKTLSSQTSQLYEIIEGDGLKQDVIDNLIETLKEMDDKLSGLYQKLFKEISEKIKMFGGMEPEDTEISILSTLSHRNLISGNTTVKYSQGGKDLPESYNGLGYMNLLSMIFNIELIRQQFAKTASRKPADLNLLFIEEPEAHTHPQMQYIFIQNIKKILAEGITNKDGVKRPLQYIISTHSSHIVSDCDFDDIKYMMIGDDNYSVVKNIKALYDAYKGNDKAFAFLKQYLTVNRSELFFADKAIFIEGDTERILLPAMMRKIDENVPVVEKERNLLSQNISVIEIGAYSHVLTEFMNFIGLKKVCVITDIDICHKHDKEIKGKTRTVTEAHEWDENILNELVTSNASLKYYLDGKEKIKEISELGEADKLLAWKEGKWQKDARGKLRICYQVEENGYHARSFEDGFMTINKEFFMSEDHQFAGLKPSYLSAYREGDIKEFELANDGIKSKANLAIDILYQSKSEDGETYKGWTVPKYIKEGLLWLRKD